MPANPVIVVPGITATYLDDRYALPPETIWSVLTNNYERAALHPDDLRYEAVEPALVRAGQLYEISYRELIEELRYNLRSREDEPVPVFPFAYDWRQPLDTTARELAALVDEVIARTRLLRHYDRDGYGKDANGNPDDSARVNLVGHSMGGLVIATYLQQAGRKARAGKVVSLATPFRGSFEAVVKVATGTANLGASPPSSREREAARMTPSLYYLLPDLPDALETDGNLPKDLFDPAAWQPSVVQTIEEYIRLRGLNSGGRRTQARQVFADFLGNARSLRDQLKGFTLAGSGLTEDDWLCVIGVDAETRVRLKIGRLGRAPNFEFRTSDRRNGWESNIPEERSDTGDGTVPYDGALPHFLPKEKVVCVGPGDYDYWELADRAATKFAGFHGILPNMNMLHRLIVRFFKELPDPRRNTWGMPPVGVTPQQWRPPLNGGLDAR